jgi:tetratricopeptide (TPR) repeat protein
MRAESRGTGSRAGTGDAETQVRDLRNALTESPENPVLLTALGSFLVDLGRYDEAERELRRALRLDPMATEARLELGVLYFRRGLYARADEELRVACSQDPENGHAHLCRGEVLNQLGRIDEALDTLQRSADLDPVPRAYYLMGILYDRKHLANEANAMYQRAREVSGRS